MAGTVIDELIVRLGLDATDYQKGSDTATQANKKLRDDAETTATELEAKGKTAASFWTIQKVELLGFLAVVAAGGKALEDLVISTANATAATAYFAQANNANPALLSGLEALAKQYGSTAAAADQAVSSVAGFQRAMTLHPDQAVNSPMYGALTALGIHVTPNEDPAQVVEQVDEKLRGMAAGGHRQQAMQFGTDMGWSLDYTNSVLDVPGSFSGQVKANETITDQEAKAATAYTQAVGKLDTATTKLDNDIMNTLAPALTGLVSVMTSIVQWFDRSPGQISNDLASGTTDGTVVPDATAPLNNTGWPDWLVNLGKQEQVESGGKQSAVSSAGAVGIMQLMPSTAEDVAKKNNIPWDPNRFKNDAGYNQNLGLLYMQQLSQQFPGNPKEIYAAYVAGPATVEAQIAAGGDNWLYTSIKGQSAKNLHAEQAYVAQLTSPWTLPPLTHIGSNLSPNVTDVLNHLRTTQVGQNKTTIHAPININDAKDPKATAKRVATALNTLGLQATRGLA